MNTDYLRKKHYALGRLPVGRMNPTETAYAARLELMLRAGEIIWYKFEGVKLRLADKTFYTCDFFVMTKEFELQCHEVKGAAAIFEDDAKVKIKVAAEMYPFRFFVAFSRSKNKGGGFDLVEY